MAGPAIIPDGSDGGAINFNKFVSIPKKKKPMAKAKANGKKVEEWAKDIPPDVLKRFEAQRKWAEGFIKDMVESSGEKSVGTDIVKKNPWIRVKPSKKIIDMLKEGDVPELQD